MIISCSNNKKVDEVSQPETILPEKKEISHEPIIISKSKSQLTDTPYIHDTINSFILRRIDDYKMYDGSIRDYVYVNNGIVAFGRKEQWENLIEINFTDYVSYGNQKLDTFDLPKKTNGIIEINSDLILKDDTTYIYEVYNTYSYVFNRRIILFTKLGFHRTTYYAYDYDLKICDTLLGKPYVVDNYLACFDDERVTDSPHLFKLFEFKNGLNLITEFSIYYLFRIEPKEVVFVNDSIINFKQELINSKTKYWRFKYK